MKKTHTIKGKENILDYYQKDAVADNYITKRFTEPLNYVEHARQVQILNNIIKIIIKENIKEDSSLKILEFAPGPARVTAEIGRTSIEGTNIKGTSIESSLSMLKLAQQRMNQKGKRWNFLQGDIFNFDFSGFEKQDLLFCFRFLLHFKTAEREKIYQQASSALRKKGHFVFEVMNKDVVLSLRRLLGKKRYFVYDKLYTRKEFIAEMEQNGFTVVRLFPVLNHFWLQALLSRPFKIAGMKKSSAFIISFLERFKSSQPYEWVALCQKK